jgi:hypothetical protein
MSSGCVEAAIDEHERCSHAALLSTGLSGGRNRIMNDPSLAVQQPGAGPRNWLSVGAGLELEQLGVQAASGHELGVAALLADAAVADDQDQVGHPHGGEAV